MRFLHGGPGLYAHLPHQVRTTGESMEISQYTMLSRKEGERLPPWWYGLAYHSDEKLTSFFYPIPINLIVRLGMRIAHYWNRWRGKPTWVDRQVEAQANQALYDIRETRKRLMARDTEAREALRRAERVAFQVDILQADLEAKMAPLKKRKKK